VNLLSVLLAFETRNKNSVKIKLTFSEEVAFSKKEIQNFLVFRHCPSPGILESRKHSVLET
jgi:hypothetical protein